MAVYQVDIWEPSDELTINQSILSAIDKLSFIFCYFSSYFLALFFAEAFSLSNNMQ